MLFRPIIVGGLQPGTGSTVRQQSGMAWLRSEPYPRRRHLCGGRPATRTRGEIPHPGEAQLAWAFVHLPSSPGQKAYRAIQRATHRDRYHRCGLWRIRPGARLLRKSHADPLQPGDQKYIGAQGPGHDPGQSHRVGRGLDRYRSGIPDHQARHHHERPGHL